MTRLAIDAVAAPPLDYRIRRKRSQALFGFESLSKCREEDYFRERRAKRSAVRGKLGEEQIRRLIRSIARSGHQLRHSLASAVYMRNVRQRVCGQLWWLVTRTAELRPRTFTLFPRGWEVPAGQLCRFDPRDKLAALRSLINRSGGSQADGYLILFIHGEFEPTRQVYQLHVHGLAAGGLLRVIDEVVRTALSIRTVPGAYGVSDFIRHRLRVDSALTNLPRPLTYLVKSYWPACAQYRMPDGRLRRQRRKTRIAEPYHTEVLLWLDSWQLKDLTLMMNLSIDHTGFRLADRAYTNGDDR